MKGFAILAASLLVASCGDEPSGARNLEAYYEHPQDVEVQVRVLETCLRASQPPAGTTYNDQDETVEACGRYADDASRYCPSGYQCLPQYRRTKNEVRGILAQGMSAKGENSRSEVEGEARQPGPKDEPNV